MQQRCAVTVVALPDDKEARLLTCPPLSIVPVEKSNSTRPLTNFLDNADLHDHHSPTAIQPDFTSLLTHSKSLLFEQKRQSMTLRCLAAQSEELRELMSLLLCKLSIPDPYALSHCYAPHPLSHPMIVPVKTKLNAIAVTASQPTLPSPNLRNSSHEQQYLPGLLLHLYDLRNQPSLQKPSHVRLCSGPTPLSTADTWQRHGLKIVFIHPNFPLINLVSSIH